MRLAQSVSGTVSEIDQIVTRIWANNTAAEVFIANVIPWYSTSSTNSNVQSDVQQLGTAIETWVTNKADSRLHLVDVRSHEVTDQSSNNGANVARWQSRYLYRYR